MQNQSRLFSLFQSKKLLIVLGIVAAVGIAAAVFLFQSDGHSAKQQASSIELYYSDGKTPLGDDVTPGFKAQITRMITSEYYRDFQRGGVWKVTTTLDYAKQQAAKRIVAAQAETIRQRHGQSTAFIAQEVATGKVVSWVGEAGSDSEIDTVNQKTMVGTLQVPFTYAAYIETAQADRLQLEADKLMFEDVQQPISGYPCTNRSLPTAGGNCLHNFDYQYRGTLTMAEALGGMRLVPVADIASSVGIDKVHELAYGLGSDGACYSNAALTDKATCYIASSFGDGLFATPAGLVSGYATLANGGARRSQTVVQAISLDGKVKYEHPFRKSDDRLVLMPQTAKAITAVLTDPRNHYLDATRKPFFTTDAGGAVAIASGVTLDARVASVVMYTDKFAAGFWINGDEQGIVGPSESLTLPVLHDWLNSATR